jgi:hypothetical protein
MSTKLGDFRKGCALGIREARLVERALREQWLIPEAWVARPVGDHLPCGRPDARGPLLRAPGRLPHGVCRREWEFAGRGPRSRRIPPARTGARSVPARPDEDLCLTRDCLRQSRSRRDACGRSGEGRPFAGTAGVSPARNVALIPARSIVAHLFWTVPELIFAFT